MDQNEIEPLEVKLRHIKVVDLGPGKKLVLSYLDFVVLLLIDGKKV
jgi:hypothetical protein